MTSPRSPRGIANLNLTQKRKLLSLAKQLKVAIEKEQGYARQANSLIHGVTESNINNALRRYERFIHMMSYTRGHLINLAQRLRRNFPTVAVMSPDNIINNAAESIRRHEKTLRNIHSGRYQTRGRGWTPRR